MTPEPTLMKWLIRIAVVGGLLVYWRYTRSRAVERKSSRSSRPSAAVASGRVVLKPIRFRTLVVEHLRASAIGVAVEEKGELRISVRYPKGKEVIVNLQASYDEYREAPEGLDEALARIEAAARESSLPSGGT